MIGKILCRLGLHRTVFKATYLPSIDAEIITDFITQVKCLRCGKVIERTHSTWDGRKLIHMTEGGEG